MTKETEMIIKNPATGLELSRMPEHDPAHIDEVFHKLRKHDVAQSFDLAQRQRSLLGFAEALEAEREVLARLLTAEMGKPIRQARAEIEGTVKRARYFAQHFSSAGATRLMHTTPTITEEIRFEPLGLILCISAWNYPYFVATSVILPALLAGCRVMFKPSELATLSGIKLVELLRNQPAFKEAIALIQGGKEVGASLVDMPFDGIFFTGSEKAGFAIKSAIGNRLIRTQFELGGKDAAYIGDDCDLNAAAASVAEGAFYNAGQSCCSIERIYVHERVAERFKSLLREAVEQLTIGDPEDEGTYIGPLARFEQLDFLAQQVADAREKGGDVLIGGHRISRAGNFFAPTIIWNANDSMDVMREESFGPVVAVEVVHDDLEAIAKINASRFGLTGAVYMQDRARAERILEKLDVGTAYWNCCDRVSPRLPWSGRKNSGLGVTLSTLGMEMFYRPKAWFLRSHNGS